MLLNLFIRDVYDPIWPNIAASIICLVAVLVKLRALEKMHKLHHKQALDQAAMHHAALIDKIGHHDTVVVLPPGSSSAVPPGDAGSS
jgi:hypothetical protein